MQNTHTMMITTVVSIVIIIRIKELLANTPSLTSNTSVLTLQDGTHYRIRTELRYIF
jgi:hypothetical protein